LESKKGDHLDGVQPGQNKKKNKKNKNKKKDAKPEDTKLTLTVETLSFFDSVKVQPPSYAKEIDEVLKQVTEKREYFIKVSDELNAKPKDEQEAPKKEEDTEEKADKKSPKKKKAKNVNLEDEEMFPSM
jgi:hypothetical protein